MNKTLEGMARAAYRAQYGAEFDSLRDGVREQFMKAAILWLANNVSDEMVSAFWDQFYSVRVDSPTNKAIAAALRAAAGDGK